MNKMPISYILNDEKINSSLVSTTDQDLNVFIPNDLKVEVSVATFLKLYSIRTRASKETWLLDISAWPLLKNAIDDLRFLNYFVYFEFLLIAFFIQKQKVAFLNIYSKL